MTEEDTEEYFVPIERILWNRDGTRRPREKAVRNFGSRAVWQAELREAVDEENLKPLALRPLSIPRRIFISYRWGTDQQNKWVENLAKELINRGYAVEFDRFANKEEKPPTVPEMVARVARCKIFLAIIDPGYVERTGTADTNRIRDGWVFDEYQTALLYLQKHQINIIGLLREGDKIPKDFPGRKLDVREPGTLTTALDNHFLDPGPHLAQNQIMQIKELLYASHNANLVGNIEEAYHFADNIIRIAPNITEGYAQKSIIAYENNEPAIAFQFARQALEMDPNSQLFLSMASKSAYAAQEANEAIKLGVRLLKLDPDNAIGHYAVGNVLDDRGQSHAALAHLEIACKFANNSSSLLNDTGIIYRHLDNPQRAISCFMRGLELSPSDVGLLVNLSATALEAGNVNLARQAMQNLQNYYPSHPAIKHISSALEKWLAMGGPPPILLPRIPKPQPIGVLTCTNCAANIPIEDQKSLLCAGCGSVLHNPASCNHCGDDNKVIIPFPGLNFNFRCPYCRMGKLNYESRDIL